MTKRVILMVSGNILSPFTVSFTSNYRHCLGDNPVTFTVTKDAGSPIQAFGDDGIKECYFHLSKS